MIEVDKFELNHVIRFKDLRNYKVLQVLDDGYFVAQIPDVQKRNSLPMFYMSFEFLENSLKRGHLVVPRVNKVQSNG